MTNPSEDFENAAGPREAEDSFGIPMVVKQVKGGERGYDLISRMMEDNIIMVQGPIMPAMAEIIVAQLLFLGAQNAGKGKGGMINMYIDSPGGVVDSGLAIYDAMNFVQAQYGIPVRTIGIGQNASMGSFLLAAGTRGYRSMLPNSHHMVHQPSAGSGGKVTDMAIAQDRVEETKQRMAMLYVAHTKMSYEKAREIGTYDYFMRAEEAVELGIVDSIMYPDVVMQKALSGQNPIQYAEGVREHLEHISKIQRALNESDMKNRRPVDEDRGPHREVIERYGQGTPTAKPAP